MLRFCAVFSAVATFVVSMGMAQEIGSEWVKIGETVAFGQTDPDSRQLPERRVDIKFPKQFIPTPSPEEPHIECGGVYAQINQWGNIGRVYKATGGWDEFRLKWDAAQQRIAGGDSNIWKCKAVIFRRIDVMYKRQDGVLEPQRAYTNLQDIIFCLETFARFEALVEAFTEGAVDVQITYSIEEDPVFGAYEGEQVWSLHPMDAGARYLRGRFNTGDYDCILYMYHPGLTRSFSFGGTIGRTNGATQAYVIISNGREGDFRIGHTEGMLHEWFHQVEATYTAYGYGGLDWANLPNLHAATQNGYTVDQVGYTGWFSWLRDLMQASVRPAMWAKLSNRTEPDWNAALSQTRRSDGRLYRWSSVSDDAWAKLPYVTADDLAARLGASSVEIKTGESQLLLVPKGVDARTPIRDDIDIEDFTLDNQLNFNREAIARIGYKDRDLLFVRFDVVDLIIPTLGDHKLGEELPENVLGYMGVDGKFVMVLDTKLDNDTSAEINLLRLGSGVGMLIKGGGDTFRDSQPVVQPVVELAGSEIAFSDWLGTALSAGNSGQLSLGPDRSGTQILKARAVAPSGERFERPFLVRMVDPVEANLRAEGTRRMSGDRLAVKLSLQNRWVPRTVKIEPSVPEGWKLDGIGGEVRLAAGERREIVGTLLAPLDAEDGLVALAVDLVIAGYDGPTRTEKLIVERYTKPVLKEDTFELTTRPGAGADGWDTFREDQGGWTAKSVEGGFKGSCLQVTDAGGIRWGRVNAFGGYLPNGKPDPEFAGYDVAAYPYLDFYLKTEWPDTLGLVVTLGNGKRYTIMLAGRYLEQWGESKQLPRARFVPNGKWQRIVYDLGSALREAEPGPHYVIDIGFGDTRKFSSNQLRDENIHSHYVDEFKITRSANLDDNTTKDDDDVEISGVANPRSPNADERARFAALLEPGAAPESISAVRALLKDESPLVRLNAAAAFTRVKDHESFEALVERARLDPDQAVGIQAVRALALIGTPQAYDALEGVVRMNRFEEFVQAEAALELGKTGQPKYINAIAYLQTAKSWQVRQMAVKALSMIKTEEAQRRAIVFLMEVDPMVRLEVTRNANVDVELVGRRIEWGSVNDLSNVVRGYSYARLTGSKDPEKRARGYAGLKEVDPEIRRIIAEELANDPQSYHVQYLVELLGDSNPDVRGAAVASLFKMPGQRSFAEVEALRGEGYEQVLLPLLLAAKEGKISIPADMLASLSKHRSQEVRALVSDLSGGK